MMKARDSFVRAGEWYKQEEANAYVPSLTFYRLRLTDTFSSRKVPPINATSKQQSTRPTSATLVVRLSSTNKSGIGVLRAR